MKTIDISPRLLVLLLAVLLIAGACFANWKGGITPSLAAILGSLAGSIPKMLEKTSLADPPPPTAPSTTAKITRELAPPIVGALSACAIALTLGG